MGTIAARDCIRILQLTEQVAAAVLLATMQAIELRIRDHQVDERNLSPDVISMKLQVFSHFDLIEEDRPIDVSLRDFVKRIQAREWNLYE